MTNSTPQQHVVDDKKRVVDDKKRVVDDKKRVVVAMSGGVDSSVAAAILQEQGYDVIGMMLRLWSEAGNEDANRCCTPQAISLARRVAAQLNIPFYVIDIRTSFENTIVRHFIDGYAQGNTPNPCIECNRSIRFGLLLEHAKAFGASALATGHYARVHPAADGSYQLLRGLDPAKDQSYVLSMLTQEQLSQALFPVGELTKPQVRARADALNFPVADRPDSQDLCFLAGDDYRNFLRRNAPQLLQPGEIVDSSGAVIGQHGGLPAYTLGQRKGLGIASSQPLYVIEKQTSSNRLVVGTAKELGRSTFITGPVNWIPALPDGSHINASVRIRYKASDEPCTISPLPDGRARVELDRPVNGITPGQAAVFYQGEQVLGGALISQVL